MIGTVLRFAGQRLLPLIAPSGGRALAKEAAINAALTIGAEQALPRIVGQEPPPIEKTLLRSALIGGLSGPVERSVIAGAKQLSPRLAGMQGRLQERLAGMPYIPESVASGLAGGAAATGKFGLGLAGMVAVTEPITKAVTSAVFPEGYSSGQNTQTATQADITGAELAATPEAVVGADPAALEHQRRLELTYARNYKFPSYIYHVSQSGTSNPFEIANQMLSTPTTRYF
jgi:hypothetical protein